jgi:glucan phosphoethanolaminetransferase (alkaline phosphatase superfamily)
MTEGTLFRIQAVVAIVVAVLLLVWPRIITWLLSLLVAGSAVVAVTLYTYVNVGELGPLPNLYENTWHQPGKIVSAIAEAVAALISLVGLVLSARTRRRRRR